MKIGVGRRGRVAGCYDEAMERFEKWETEWESERGNSLTFSTILFVSKLLHSNRMPPWLAMQPRERQSAFRPFHDKPLVRLILQ
jgi:hypothetical protein